MANPTVLQKVPFSIIPKDANGAGADVDNNPTALTDIVWSVDTPAVASLVQNGPFQADLVPTTPGTVTVTVTAKNVLGETLTESSAPVTFDDAVAPPPPVPVVKSLNLQASDPVSK